MEKISFTPEELVFYVYFSILFGMKMIGISDGNAVYSLLLLAGLAFYGLKELITRKTVLEWILTVLLLGTAMLIYLHSGEKAMLLDFSLLLAVKNVPEKRVFSLAGILFTCGLGTITFLRVFGILPDNYKILPDYFGGYTLLHSLGFPHNNVVLTTFAIGSMTILYLCGNKSKLRTAGVTLLLWVTAGGYFQYVTGRTGFIACVLFGLLNFYFQFYYKGRAFEKICIRLVYPFCVVVSVILPLILKLTTYQSSIEDRLRLAYYYYQNNTPKLFGQVLSNPQGEVFGVDIALFNLLMQSGIIAFAIVSILNIGLVEYAIKKQRKDILAIAVCMFILGITEPLLYNTSFKNILFIFMGYMVSDLAGRAVQRGNRCAWIGREWKPLPVRDRIFDVKIRQSGRKAAEQLYRKRGRVLLTSVLAGCLIGLCTYFYVQSPQTIYIREDIPNSLPEEICDQTNLQDISDQPVFLGYMEGAMVVNFTRGTDLGFYPLQGEVAHEEALKKSITAGCYGLVLILGLQALWQLGSATIRQRDQQKM